MNLNDLPDDKLNELDDAITAELMRRKNLDGEFGKAIAGLSDDELYDLGDKVDVLAMDRREKQLNGQAAHFIEQSDARAVDNPYAERLFVERCARLFKLAQLNAPKVIVEHAVKMVVKYAPASASYEFKW